MKQQRPALLQKPGEITAFSLLLLTTGLMLGTVCSDSKDFPTGELIAQYVWLEKAMMGFAAATGIAALLAYRKIQCFVRPEDILVLFVTGYLFLHYDTDLNPSAERINLLRSLGILWFALRITLASFPELKRCLLWMITAFGVYEAILGFCQIYGLAASNHSLFTLTGTFFNPGPYSGYLAIAFATGIGLYTTETNRWLRYILGVMVVLIGVLLPAGMSRSAWLAAGSGCAVVLLMNPTNRTWCKTQWKKRSWLRKTLPALLVLFLIGICTGLFFIKPDSANGRLFMWKISLRAIAERPLAGYGMGQFAPAYASAQETYFAAGYGSESEEYVAGTPEYAFNEYLQLAVEGGVPFLIMVVAFVALSIWRGIRNGQTGAVAGVVAFGVFALSSYPTQSPAILIVGWMLLGVCQAPQKEEYLSVFPRVLHISLPFLFGLIYILLSLYKLPLYEKTAEACRKWQTARIFYNTQAYKVAEREYKELYETLKNRPEFRFEYALCLRHLNSWGASNKELEQTLRISGDPMILNVMGRNYTDLGEWEKAESCFKRSIHRLPGRLYPYYLLVKLYAIPEYYHPELVEKLANTVLTKKEKIPSHAIREMRREVKTILNNANQ